MLLGHSARNGRAIREIIPSCHMLLSSRAQARATLGREFPIFALSMAKRVPSPTLVHGSCALSKIPYGGFSPVRLQAEASGDQLSPSRKPLGLSARSACPQATAGLREPSSSSSWLASTVGIINATSRRLLQRPPQPKGPWLQVGSVVPLILTPTTRSASLEDSHRFPRVTGYTRGLCPTTSSGLSPRPSLLCLSAPSLRATLHAPVGERGATVRFFPHSNGLPQSYNGSAQVSRHRFPSGGHHDAARFASGCGPQACSPSWIDPTGRRSVGRRRRLHPSLLQKRSLASRVGYDYTASPDGYCDRTYTGWNAAVTGCAQDLTPFLFRMLSPGESTTRP